MFLVRLRTDEGLVRNRIVSNQIADQMIAEEVMEHFIPEVLIEILTAEGSELKGMSAADRQVHDLYNMMEREVVTELAGSMVQIVISQFVEGYLSNVPGQIKVQHPLWALVDFLIEDSLGEMVTAVVEEVVGELVEVSKACVLKMRLRA
jgi:hypothetical protein